MPLWYFECTASFCKRCEAFCILFVQLLDMYGKKRQSFENVCKQLKVPQLGKFTYNEYITVVIYFNKIHLI